MPSIKINNYFYFFLLISFLSGFIKDTFIIFLIVIIHEFGHVLWALIFKRKIISVTLYPFGGITKNESLINSHSYQDLLIYFGGIFNQILLFIILFLILKLGLISFNIYELVYKYNLTIMLFNMLPIIPLDGYLIINYLFNSYYNYKKSYYFSIGLSFISLTIYLYLNYLLNINNYLITGFLIFKILEYYKNYNFVYDRLLLERYLYHLKFKNSKKMYDNTLDDLYLNTKHYFYVDKNWVSEDILLKKMFDKSEEN